MGSKRNPMYRVYMKFILIGIQGAGKSTQGNMMSAKLNIPYLSSGHIFRQMSREKTPWGRYVKEVVNSGSLMPDDKTIEVVNEYLAKEAYANGYILDGFPRTVTQAKLFKNGVDGVIFLNVSEKEAVWRLYGRMDDEVREDNNLEAIRRRIKLFHEQTMPVVEYYRSEGKLLEINGEQSIEDIHTEIMQRVNDLKL